MTSESICSDMAWTRKLTETPHRAIFKDARFCFLLFGTSIALFPLFVPPFFLPLFAGSVGLSTTTSSYLLAGAFKSDFVLTLHILRIVFCSYRLQSRIGRRSYRIWTIRRFATRQPELSPNLPRTCNGQLSSDMAFCNDSRSTCYFRGCQRILRWRAIFINAWSHHISLRSKSSQRHLLDAYVTFLFRHFVEPELTSFSAL